MSPLVLAMMAFLVSFTCTVFGGLGSIGIPISSMLQIWPCLLINSFSTRVLCYATINSYYYAHPAIKRMLSSHYKLLFIKHMRLIGVAFYELDFDQLESMWSPDIFGEIMAMMITLSCKKIEFQTNRQHSQSWGAAVNAKALDWSSQLALAGLTSITCPNICGRGYVQYKRISFIKCILSFRLPL